MSTHCFCAQPPICVSTCVNALRCGLASLAALLSASNNWYSVGWARKYTGRPVFSMDSTSTLSNPAVIALCDCPCRRFWAQQAHVSTSQLLQTLACHLSGTEQHLKPSSAVPLTHHQQSGTTFLASLQLQHCR